MLDDEKHFNTATGESIVKYRSGDVQLNIYGDGREVVDYERDGIIRLTENEFSANITTITYTTYYLNGTVTLARTQSNHTIIITSPNQNLTTDVVVVSPGFSSSQDSTVTEVTDNSTLKYTYQELWNMRPLQDTEEVASLFTNETGSPLKQFGPLNVTWVTSDYGFYWYDYKAGYDVMLAQLGWNISDAQQIGLVRGAANLQNKSWGTIVTWKYRQEPYLASGQEIFDQLKLSYLSGAKYVVVFNYAENMTGPYGTLKDEHFGALQRFWNDVVKSPFEHQGSIKAEAAFVLPNNYGGGLRKADDTVWGLWQPSGEYQQIYPNLQKALSVHGEKLDIVYEDPAYPVAENYPQTIYWNQTG